jgi:hypothetical protein
MSMSFMTLILHESLRLERFIGASPTYAARARKIAPPHIS